MAFFQIINGVLLNYRGCDSNVVIPSTVTSIGFSAFRDCESMVSVVIPDSVTFIASSAFYHCSKLTSVTLSNSLTFINDYSFAYCESLTSITIPNSVTSINPRAFAGCENLTSVTIPDSVTSIDLEAFIGCGLTNITIPDSVTSIGDRAFTGCPGLADEAGCIVVRNVLHGYASSSSDVVIPNSSATFLTGGLFAERLNLTSVVIPNSVTSIGEKAFSNCSNLKSVVIPDSVTFIGPSAFWGCSSLASITLPHSLTSISASTFAGCTSLTSITIPDSVTSIGSCAFVGCENLTSISIPDSVLSIGAKAFLCCDNLANDAGLIIIRDILFGCLASKVHVTVPDSVTSISDSAFQYCDNLTSVIIPNSVASIGAYAFFCQHSLTSVILPESITVLPSYIFSHCSGLVNVSIPNSVTTIEMAAFSDCTSLTSITIPDSVTSIGWKAFSGCTSLTSVVIPDSVVSIDTEAFAGCKNLRSFTCPSTFGQQLSHFLQNTNNSFHLHIPDISKVSLRFRSNALLAPADAYRNCSDEVIQKCRSEYPISTILAGSVPDEIKQRARNAKFDERLVLTGLMLDDIIHQAQHVMDEHKMLTKLMDVIKTFQRQQTKTTQTPNEVYRALIEEQRKPLTADMDSADAAPISPDDQHILQLLIACMIEEAKLLTGLSGADAFAALKQDFDVRVQHISTQAEATGRQMTNMFDFAEAVFDEEPELLMIVTELTANKDTAAFIGRFGCEAYYRHNKELLRYVCQEEIQPPLKD